MKPVAAFVLPLQLALLLLIPASAQQTPAPIAARAQGDLHFVPNRGQVVDTDGRPRPEIRYVSSSNGMTLYLADDRISYVFSQVEGDIEHHRHADGFYDADHPEPTLKLYRMDLEFVAPSGSHEIAGDLPTGSYSNFYLPHLPSGLTHVASQGRVTYRNIYPNIDFVIYRGGDDAAGRVKYDFVVRPGGRVSDIRMRYTGATSQRITSGAELVTATPLGVLNDAAPVTFQQSASAIDGAGHARQTVPSRYRLDDGLVSFVVGVYDTTRTLVIDPSQSWSTYIGGSGNEELNGGDVTEIDRSGNVLITGFTDNGSFPTTPGAFQTTLAGSSDVFVVKMTPRGALLWSTVYGGTAQELGHGIVSDRSGNIFIAGHTFSTNFPTTAGAHQTTFGGVRDAFAVKFDSNGVRQWGTYYGGPQFDDSYGFAIDSLGNPAMIGTTGSTSGIATAGAFQTTYAGNSSNNYDAFVARFNGAGARQWGSYVGGTGLEYGYGAAADIGGSINITGWTNSGNLPVTSGAFQQTRAGGHDAFVMRFNSAGTRIWGSYFGGTGNEGDDPGAGGIGFAAITTDGEGNAIITGVTTSTNLPVSPSATQRTFGGGTCDAYIAKFDALGARIWSTYYGGSNSDFAQGVASNARNGVLVVGHTLSTNLPGIVTGTSFQPAKAGASGTSDAFLVKLSGDGTTREYATYYGGSGNDEGVGVSVDRSGSIFIAGLAGDGFPVTSGAWQSSFGGGSTDAFLAYFCDIDPPAVTSSGPTVICTGDSVRLVAPEGYARYLWHARGLSGFSEERSITIKVSGEFWVQVTNELGCTGYSDTISVQVGVETPTITATGRTLTSSAASDYQWFRNGVPIPGATGKSYTAESDGSYSVTITSQAGCMATSEPLELRLSAVGDEDPRFGAIGEAARLLPAQPNPATGTTTIEYRVTTPGRVRLLLVDMLGRSTPIVDAEIVAGRYIATFDASELPSGAYYCILQTPTERVTQNLTIRK